MKHLRWLILLFILAGCNETGENEVDQKTNEAGEQRFIRERFDSIDRKMDSFNKKVEKGLDSAIHEIDSLLKELDKKKKENKVR